MKPNVKLAETTTPDGGRLALYEHDGTYCIRLNGLDLMHSAATSSELHLGALAAEPLSHQREPVFLLGGLGLGFTLRGLLDKAGPGAKVQVAELIPEIVRWNRDLLRNLNGALLDDPRVEVVLRDVWDLIVEASPARYDAVLLDVDNGPTGMVQKQNSRLYTLDGLDRIARVLKPGGRALFWSADNDLAFAKRLGQAGFKTQVVPALLYAGAHRHKVTIYIAGRQARRASTPTDPPRTAGMPRLR